MPLIVRGKLNPGTEFQALGSGSETNPPVAFRASQQTGLFLNGASTLGVTSNGKVSLSVSESTTRMFSESEKRMEIQEGNLF